MSDDWMSEMQKETAAIKTRMSGGGGKMWSVYGEKAIAAPGKSASIRLVPHPDDGDEIVVAGGKISKNEDFKPSKMFFKALGHWYETSEGRRHAWCARTFDKEAACPLCEHSAELKKSSDKGEKEAGEDMKAKDEFLLACVVGPSGNRLKNDEGFVDIRPISVPASVFAKIGEIMHGGGEADFAAGFIASTLEGYELRLDRPAGKGQRWDVQCAKHATTLWAKDGSDLKLFAKKEDGKTILESIYARFPNLEEAIRGEIKSYDDLSTDFHGAGASSTPGGEGDGGSDEDPFAAMAGDGDSKKKGKAKADEPADDAGDDAPAGDTEGDDPFADFGAPTDKPSGKKDTKKKK